MIKIQRTDGSDTPLIGKSVCFAIKMKKFIFTNKISLVAGYFATGVIFHDYFASLLGIQLPFKNFNSVFPFQGTASAIFSGVPRVAVYKKRCETLSGACFEPGESSDRRQNTSNFVKSFVPVLAALSFCFFSRI